MIITHQKGECIKASVGNVTLVFNPISKKSTLPAARFGADMALVTLNHPDFNGVAEVTRADKEPFTITGPGEYEVSGVFVKGFPSSSDYSKEVHINTMYAVRLEDINLLFLGATADAKPDPALTEDIDSVDVLFVPIGNEGVLDPAAAHALAVALEAKITIPIHYDGLGMKGALKTFLKEAGAEDTKPVEKLTI
ncbi:MAG: MBL fold metallo-hydrolase, partial [bacterium]|nr:MBL fold metallo-hydrolase [bacterium]